MVEVEKKSDSRERNYSGGDRFGSSEGRDGDGSSSRQFGGSRRFRKFAPGRRRKCTPCNPEQFQWKDVAFLSRFQTPTGKLMSRKRTGFCSQCQKRLSRAVKRARFMALIPYTT